MEEIKNDVFTIFNKIIDIENRYQLFDLQINGIYIWKIIRFALESEIHTQILYSNLAHDDNKSKKSNL